MTEQTERKRRCNMKRAPNYFLITMLFSCHNKGNPFLFPWFCYRFVPANFLRTSDTSTKLSTCSLPNSCQETLYFSQNPILLEDLAYWRQVSLHLLVYVLFLFLLFWAWSILGSLGLDGFCCSVPSENCFHIRHISTSISLQSHNLHIQD